jgi:hypothetical protein
MHIDEVYGYDRIKVFLQHFAALVSTVCSVHLLTQRLRVLSRHRIAGTMCTGGHVVPSFYILNNWCDMTEYLAAQ